MLKPQDEASTERARFISNPPIDWLIQVYCDFWNVALLCICGLSLLVSPLLWIFASGNSPAASSSTSRAGLIVLVLGPFAAVGVSVVFLGVDPRGGRIPAWAKELICNLVALIVNAAAAYLSVVALDSDECALHLTRICVAFKMWPFLMGSRARTAFFFLLSSLLIDVGGHKSAVHEFGDLGGDVSVHLAWVHLAWAAFFAGAAWFLTFTSLRRCARFHAASLEHDCEWERLLGLTGSLCGHRLLWISKDGCTIEDGDLGVEQMFCFNNNNNNNSSSLNGLSLQSFMHPTTQLEDEGRLALAFAKAEASRGVVELPLTLQVHRQRQSVQMDVVILSSVRRTRSPACFLVALNPKSYMESPQSSKEIQVPVQEDQDSGNDNDDMSSVQSLTFQPSQGRSNSPACSGSSSAGYSSAAFKHIDNYETETLQMVMSLGQHEHWLIDKTDITETGQVLGIGGFGQVVAGEFKGCKVAIKSAKPEKHKEIPLLNELRVLRHLRHPNVVLFFGAYLNPTTADMALIFELVEGVTLQVYIESEPAPSCDSRKLNILSGMACALQYLHYLKKPIVHGDLKDSNVFVETWHGGPRSKLADFGLSRLKHSKSCLSMGGTLRWMAPEILLGMPLRPEMSTDIFSFGRIMSYTLSGSRPCSGMHRTEVIKMARLGQVPELDWGEELRETNLLAERIAQIGRACAVWTPNQRPDILKIVAILEACAQLCSPSPSPVLGVSPCHSPCLQTHLGQNGHGQHQVAGQNPGYMALMPRMGGNSPAFHGLSPVMDQRALGSPIFPNVMSIQYDNDSRKSSGSFEHSRLMYESYNLDGSGILNSADFAVSQPAADEHFQEPPGTIAGGQSDRLTLGEAENSYEDPDRREDSVIEQLE
eukprot:CAMPEP_0115093000 /NCGR_PEP_ID=MMETSP0227-20121206/27183_1 /TAXON_ID=89957 /ORGANISM="Polarella glacialis, Strain CCMP 1383" /LENGTH=876 /DNA_ID=CAMNT_0002485091 /DNA_START=109 /DNA_END=2740 /DNA_ORIENTATION=+